MRFVFVDPSLAQTRDEDVDRKTHFKNKVASSMSRQVYGVTGSDPELTRKLNLHVFAHVRVDAAHMRL